MAALAYRDSDGPQGQDRAAIAVGKMHVFFAVLLGLGGEIAGLSS